MMPDLDKLPSPSDLNEHARPKAPRLGGASNARHAGGRRLTMIHRMHLQDLNQVRELVNRIDQDSGAANMLVQAIDDLALIKNLRNFGALCGRECNNLLFHHGAEENHMFPAIEAIGGDGLRAVVAKLRQEHEVVHALLEALHEQAVITYNQPTSEHYTVLREIFNRLDTAIRSHFGYEETELEEVLGQHAIL